MAYQVSIPHRRAKNLNKHPEYKPTQPKFQSLIGELKTFKCKYFRENIKNVSIPHRRAKNINELEAEQILVEGFNPS